MKQITTEQEITNNDLYEFISEKFIKLENTQDYMLGELKLLNGEKTVSAYRSTRIENWVIEAAKKLNLPYNP